jgi:hypothetical protein
MTDLALRFIGPNDFVVVEDSHPIGRIKLASELRGELWYWNVTIPVPGVPGGSSASLEDAKVALARKNENSAYLTDESAQERVSEVDLMSGKYPSSFQRRVERQWAERIKSLSRIHGQIVVAAVQMLQHVFSHHSSLILIPVRTVVHGRRLDRQRARD